VAFFQALMNYRKLHIAREQQIICSQAMAAVTTLNNKATGYSAKIFLLLARYLALTQPNKVTLY